MVVIFVDVDGVVADFVAGVLVRHGRTDVRYDDVEWGIEAQLGIEPSAFWSVLDRPFWSGLQPYADGLALLAEAERLVGPQNIGLLTSPADTDGCIDGKRDWVKRYLPDYRRRLFTGSAKELIAGPAKILIDDNDTNVDKFADAGGLTVQPPRPWNRRKAETLPGGRFDPEVVAAELRQAVGKAKLAAGVRG